MITNNKDDSDAVSPNAYIGDLSVLNKISAFSTRAFNDQESANIPNAEAILKAQTVAGTDKNVSFISNKIDLKRLLNDYNKNRYYSPSANIESSYFKIGPL